MIKTSPHVEVLFAIKNIKTINPKMTNVLRLLAEILSAYPPTKSIRTAEDKVANE